MQLCVVGVNHSTTPVSLRGKVAIGTSQLQNALISLHNYVPQGIILSTCNRIEIYSLTETGFPAQSASINFLKAKANLAEVDLSPYIYTYHDEAAITHLFKVASGLDSMVIGEYEVLGQVRQALEEAEKSQLVGLPLLNLFRYAVRVGRHVREETGISRNALSVSSVAVDLAVRVIGNITRSKILVIGAGEAGRLVAKASRDRGATQITVASRSQEKASTLAAMLGGNWVSLNNLRQEIEASDIVISCTGAPHFVLKQQLVEEVMNFRREHPLVIIDIAVPQDVEPEVKQLRNVFLYDIDDLTQVTESNYKQRQEEIQKAIEIVNKEVQRFVSWWQALEVKPVIKALMAKAENIRQTQLNLTLKKLPSLSEEDRTYLDVMTKAIVQKVLHEPIQFLKKDHQKESIRLINELFNLKYTENSHKEVDYQCLPPSPYSSPLKGEGGEGDKINTSVIRQNRNEKAYPHWVSR